MSSFKLINPILFTQQQSRQEIINSILNTSKAKAAWTFSKQKRFPQQNTQNQQANYSKTISVINRTSSPVKKSLVPKAHSYRFGRSQRKLFTEISDAPSCWIYNPEQLKVAKWKNTPLLEGRQNCISGSYIDPEKLKNPGPANYKVQSLQRPTGYTMRPKTGHERTYFIQNREAQEVPGPGNYGQNFQSIARKSFNSRFKDNLLGTTGIRSKSKRFVTQPDKKCILSTQLYNKLKTPWEKGCSIGSQKRKSFIDMIITTNDRPGPGNYQLPSEFGHYKKIQRRKLKTLNSNQ